MALQFK